MKFCANRRGAILMLVIVFGFIVSAIGMAVIYINGQARLNVNREYTGLRALYAAEAGCERARAEIFSDGVDHNAFPEFRPGHSGDLTSYKPFGEFEYLDPSPEPYSGTRAGYQVTIAPDSDNNIADGGVYCKYVVTSSGVVTSGTAGTFDTVKVISYVVTITSHTYTVAQPWHREYNTSGTSWDEEPGERVIHQ